MDQAKAESSQYLELKSGDKVKLRILQGPLTYRTYYGATTEKNEKGDGPKKRTFNIPFAAQVPGYKFRGAFAFEVVILDGAAKGQRKVWKAGQKVADQLKAIKDLWGSIREPLIELKREGEKLETVWTVTAGKGDGMVYPCQIKLEEAIGYASAADLALLPPPVKPAKEGSLSSPITIEQSKFISDLAEQKELGLAFVLAQVARKFSPKTEIDQLTSGEASQLIDLMKGI